MRPLHHSDGGGRFGPIDLRSTAAKLAAGLVVGSVLNAVLGADWLMLVPAAVLNLPIPAFWQPFTYGFVTRDPFVVVFGGLVLWFTGRVLESVWGSRRLLAFALGVTVTAGLLTALLVRLGMPAYRGAAFSGAWVMGSAVWVAYGLLIGRSQTNFWGLPVTGNQFAAIGAGLVVLNAVLVQVLPVLPALLGLVITFAYMKGFYPHRLWGRLRERFQAWRSQRQLKGRSRHLKVISPDRNTPRDSDSFLH
jgi:membrane associated rhomboid family serine protease